MIATSSAQPGFSLRALARHAVGLKKVCKEELDYGDWVVVTTRNSTYSIHVLEDGLYSISGGWVDQQGQSPLETKITGCSWGGSAIMTGLVAACGLRLEFGERVITTAIQRIVVIRSSGRRSENRVS